MILLFSTLFSLARFSLALSESYLGIHITKLFREFLKDKELELSLHSSYMYGLF